MQRDVADALHECLPRALGDPGARLFDVVPAGNGFSGLTYKVRVDRSDRNEGPQTLVVRLGRRGDVDAPASLAAQWRVVTTLAAAIGSEHLQEPVWSGPLASPSFSSALVLTYVPGVTLAAAATGEEPGPFRSAGRALARIHQVRPPAGLEEATGEDWSDYILHSIDAVARRQAEWEDSDPVLRYAVARLRRWRPSELPLVLLHGDPNPDNVILRPGLMTAALIDWERHRVGDPREDLGWLSYMQRLEARQVARPLAGLLEGYGEVSGLGRGAHDDASVAYFALFSAVKLVAARRRRPTMEPLLNAYWQGVAALDRRAWLDLCALLPE